LPYKSVFTKGFKKEFRKLPEEIKDRVIEAIARVSTNPYAGTKLRGTLEGLWRWRIGKYRIIYAINEGEKTIVFLDIGLRRTIYE